MGNFKVWCFPFHLCVSVCGRRGSQMLRDWQHKNVSINIPSQLNHLCVSFRYISFNLISFLSRVAKVKRVKWGLAGVAVQSSLPSAAGLFPSCAPRSGCSSYLKQWIFRDAYLKTVTCLAWGTVCAAPFLSPRPTGKAAKPREWGDLLGSSNWNKYFSHQSSVFLTKLKITKGNFSLDVVEDDSVMPLSM